MSLFIKSQQNHGIADYASEKKYYDVAVSRYYYSCLQYLLYYFDRLPYRKRESIKSFVDKSMEEKFVNIQAVSHIRILEYYKKLLDNDSKKQKKFNNLYLAIKSLRVEADYNDTLLTVESVQEAQTQTDELKKVFKIN